MYSKHVGDAVIIGLRASAAHANSRGFVHDSLISALADNALGLSCALKAGTASRLVTVSLTVDFLDVAAAGQWLEFMTDFMKIGGTLCFAQGFVIADEVRCARANAVFKVVRSAATV